MGNDFCVYYLGYSQFDNLFKKILKEKIGWGLKKQFENKYGRKPYLLEQAEVERVTVL